MTQAIQTSNTAHQYSPQPSALNETSQMSYRETMAQSSQSEISITTSQGDVVTISSFKGESQSVLYDRWNSPLEQGMNFTASSIKSNSFSLSVQGDLNEEELTDIQYLLDDLALIAEDFFNGDLDQAMAGALNLGDMGTLTKLSATFTSSASWSANQLTQTHPIPLSGEFADLLGELMDDLPQIPAKQENSATEYAQKLQAQWQQIKEIIEERDAVLPPGAELGSTASADNLSPAEKMMERMDAMLSIHPRLSPFALLLGHEAIDKQADKLQQSGVLAQKDQLKNDFLQELNDWMYG